MLCGLGAVGLTVAQKLQTKCELKILVDDKRKEKYLSQEIFFNNTKQHFDYITSSNKFEPELIIISTKSLGLDSAIENIKNFVTPNTYIISLLNGISSEEKIMEKYPQAIVAKSYFIGHSAMREGNRIIQDGIWEIVIEDVPQIINIFKECSINYTIPPDIDYSMWLKFAINIFSNQTSAILNLNFGELKNNQQFINFAKKLIQEVKMIAEKKGIDNLESLEKDALQALSQMTNDGKTSMLQDILACRETEVEIFAGEILKLGKLFNIKTPYNQVLYDLIKIKENVK